MLIERDIIFIFKEFIKSWYECVYICIKLKIVYKVIYYSWMKNIWRRAFFRDELDLKIVRDID